MTPLNEQLQNKKIVASKPPSAFFGVNFRRG
jgi:hypothetical protein